MMSSIQIRKTKYRMSQKETKKVRYTHCKMLHSGSNIEKCLLNFFLSYMDICKVPLTAKLFIGTLSMRGL